MIKKFFRYFYHFLLRIFKISSAQFPSAPYRFGQKEAELVAQVVESGKLTHTTGHNISQLEQEFAGYIGSKNAIATNSGTSALVLAVKSVGVKPGDEVIIPGYTFIAVAQAVLINGAIPIFADLDDSFNISPESIRQKINKKTKAIIAVHMFGNPANIFEIKQICEKHDLKLIEDCAQAVGAGFNGCKLGSIGDVGCFSFNEFKALPTGQGGMLVTSDKTVFTKAQSLLHTGEFHHQGTTDVITISGTYFMTEMQAVIARSILAQLDKLNSVRIKNFEWLQSHWRPLEKIASLYHHHSLSEPSYSRLVFMLKDKYAQDRDQIINDFHQLGIPLKTYYPTPLYQYKLFQKKKDQLNQSQYPFNLNKNLSYPKLPFTEKFCQRQLGFEFSPYLKKKNLEHFVNSMKNYFL